MTLISREHPLILGQRAGLPVSGQRIRCRIHVPHQLWQVEGHNWPSHVDKVNVKLCEVNKFGLRIAERKSFRLNHLLKQNGEIYIYI